MSTFVTQPPTTDSRDDRDCLDGQRAATADERARVLSLLTELHSLPVDSPRRTPLREELARVHLPLVRYLARRLANHPDALQDVVQVGSIGLLKAIDRFDPSRGLEFSTYAVPTITGEIRRHFRDTGWLLHVPRRAQEIQAGLHRAESALSQQLHRAPTAGEVAQWLGVPVDRVIEAKDVARTHVAVPTDAIDEAEGPTRLPTSMVSIDAGFDQVETRTMLWPALAELPLIEREVLILRYVADHTQAEISRMVGVSQMQVSRLLARALKSLQERMAAPRCA